MAKDAKRRGRSARNGNAKSPYSKYNKTPFEYPSNYKHNVLSGGTFCRFIDGRLQPVMRIDRNKFKDAAE